jgi:hypothetical protein
LKDLKNSNVLVSIFINDLNSLSTLEETFYSISQQKHGIDFLVIHPKKFKSDDIKKLESALNSPRITITTKGEDDKIKTEEIKSDKKINYHLHACDLDNFSKVFNETFNVAYKNQYEYFSTIEQGDIVGLNWYLQAVTYAVENPEVGMFMPIIRNTTNGVFSGLLNEAPWMEGMSEEAGFADLNLLLKFNCIAPNGGLFNVKTIHEYSEEKNNRFYPFKESMKISHCYEFLLRMIYNDIKVMTVPRIGYEFRIIVKKKFQHTSCKIPQNIIQIDEKNGGVSNDELKFWLELAKKEYFFDEDRNKTYEQSKK